MKVCLLSNGGLVTPLLSCDILKLLKRFDGTRIDAETNE